MKSIYDNLSHVCSRNVTKSYSTSFYFAVSILSPTIRQDIHNIYAFVRLADEIVDSFHDFEKVALLQKFERDFFQALNEKISLNPILNAFQETVHRCDIDLELVNSFLKSMKMDLYKQEYHSQMEIDEYIYGSADVVGLMCLKVFVKGDQEKYEKLKYSAMKLGSAFQKVNFLRDLKADLEGLNRTYFPNVDFTNFCEEAKGKIIAEIEQDFTEAHQGIRLLPLESRLGVYSAYKYYKRLLMKLKKTHAKQIANKRIRVNNANKMYLLLQSYMQVKLNLL